MDRQIKKSENKFAELVNKNLMFNKNVLAKKALTLACQLLFNLAKVQL